jgi:retron-type reverse transcriptase
MKQKSAKAIVAIQATPLVISQDGPLSPLLANILLDDLDKELEKRGHHFVRYADDCVPRRHRQAAFMKAA